MLGKQQPQPRKATGPSQKHTGLSDEELSRARREFIFEQETLFKQAVREDIVGINYILDDIDKYVYFLRHFDEMHERAAEIDKGIILVGTYGTGKTLTARYIATETGARFINAEDFPKRKAQLEDKDIAELFLLAREFVREQKQPVVLFWDEFAVFGKKLEDCKEGQASGVRRLITELSGMEEWTPGIFLVAATTDIFQIEKALLRPGRIGKRYDFVYSRQTKRDLLKHYVAKYEMAEDIDFETLSFLIASDAVPAGIEETCKEAWRDACFRVLTENETPRLTNDILVKVFLRNLRGSPLGIMLHDDAFFMMSVYEAGRALVARTLGFPTQLVALTQRGYLSAHRTIEPEQVGHETFEHLLNSIAARYGGVAAQEICGIPPNTTGTSDIREASVGAQRFVEEMGGSSAQKHIIAGIATSRENNKIPSALGMTPEEADTSYRAITGLLDEQKARARAILNVYGKDVIEGLARMLRDKGYLFQKDIDAFVKPEAAKQKAEKKDDKPKTGFIK